MKHFGTVLLGMAWAACAAGGAQAHEPGEHTPSTAHDAAEHFTHKGVFTVTGEVIDVACYIADGKDATGTAHKACATKCVKSGMPVGLLLDDGTIVLAITAEHGPANELLLPYLATRVRAAGTMSQSGSTRLLAVAKVEPAPAGMAKPTDVKAGATKAAAKEVWVCPMGCEEKVFDKEGKCPVCGMDLVKQKG